MSERPQRVLSVQWEELTATDFPAAVAQAQGVCLLPIGVIEKHGPHLPLGTDVMAARATAARAAQREYAVVFPPYYFGQIWEARHQPGCITLPAELLTAVLQAVCEEIHRNGFSKILIVNGHGGNTFWLNYFCQSQLASRREYATYVARWLTDPELAAQIEARRRTERGGHSDEIETSRLLALRPELVKMEDVVRESGATQGRLKGLDQQVFTGVFYYADYPNHYHGIADEATRELGELIVESEVRGLVKILRAVKEDTATIPLQNEFYGRAEQPLP